MDMSEYLRPSMVGERNPNWNGGTAEYPNHSLMKRRRKERLEMDNYVCFRCGGKATLVHHLDGGKTDHSLSNLASSCRVCHISGLHVGRKNKISRFRNITGYSLQELSDLTGWSPWAVGSKIVSPGKMTLAVFSKLRSILGKDHQLIVDIEKKYLSV